MVYCWFLLLLLVDSRAEGLLGVSSQLFIQKIIKNIQLPPLFSYQKSSIPRSHIEPTELQRILEAGTIPSPQREFLINGWRWHTQAVLRDIRRFKRVIATCKESSDDQTIASTLTSCHNFVCNFNWNALLKIESEIFFPWLSDLLPLSVAKSLINSLYQKHADIRALSAKLGGLCQNYQAKDDLVPISAYLEEMLNCAAAIQNIQESIFVPFVAAYVSTGEQERFNRLVIAKLGLVESQVHLVSMFDAIEGQPVERRLFEKQIPRIAQTLIPLWRKRLYMPRAKSLVESNSSTHNNPAFARN